MEIVFIIEYPSALYCTCMVDERVVGGLLSTPTFNKTN